MSYENLVLEKDGPVATIALNRPESLNALSMKLRDELQQALKDVREDTKVRALIVTGRGRAFCSGADIRELQTYASGDVPSKAMDMATQRILGITGLGKPVIAAINGVAAGGGFSLAMMCDIRLMAHSARFVSTFVKRGLVPDGGLTYTLTQLVGVARAAEIMFTADGVDAEQAEKLGLVNAVVADAELMDAARSLALKISQHAPLAVKGTKEAIYLALKGDLKASLEFEAQVQMGLFRTRDFQEGIRSFLEKREPVFRGE